MEKRTVAQLMVESLKNEGVKYVFGIPGEENINFVDAIDQAPDIEFILARHEQGAAFMASVYGRLMNQAGVCVATLGPGALNLVLGVADAQTNSTPLVAISAQGGLNRIHKESHQVIDLVSMFRPVTQWSQMILEPGAIPEMMRKAFSLAERDRPGATYLALPQDVEQMPAPETLQPLPIPPASITEPTKADIEAAVDLIKSAKHPIILAGHGVVLKNAEAELQAFSRQFNIPVATTFMAKGAISDREANALGVVGFMRHDYENFAFDQADLIIAVGFSIQQFDPAKINPNGDKKILHINMFREDPDSHYNVSLNIVANIAKSLARLNTGLQAENVHFPKLKLPIKKMRHHELTDHVTDDSFPLKPQKIVTDTRAALADDDIVLVDTGAVKMWMARLFETYATNTCLIDNGLSTMGWALPGAIGAKLAAPNKRVLAVMGDGSFLMNVQEIETAVREDLHLVILVWADQSYGLIKWKMDLSLKHHSQVDFTNPDIVTLARSFGAIGYNIQRAQDLALILAKALAATKGVHIISVPVDYSENMKLINRLGNVTIKL
ncbi:acetolactate synthase large subunit [Lactobacillus sp. CC-MHH1034]|uniref:acetolactate synthase large subunit n=1 Tax=Agrilactobacillus fermenti TaxID=2586909 RepID=UPI001E52DD95|nr:acetolactate synthase large subunit [Agrilactobacillus fermenti]MCD2256835.1 acetolactate synthase large subunit [Agrilactobacillus fermenti]